MGDVIDARPDRFLREMRDHGTWAKACELSGLSPFEAKRLCTENPKFDLAQVECLLEFSEEFFTQMVEEVIAEAEAQIAISRTALAGSIAACRALAMGAYRKRHNGGED